MIYYQYCCCCPVCRLSVEILTYSLLFTSIPEEFTCNMSQVQARVNFSHCRLSYHGALDMSLCIMGYGTQHPHTCSMRKSTLNFTTSSSLVLIKPILDEIQPFKNSSFYYEIHMDAGQIVRRIRLSIHFLVNFFKVFEWLYLVQYWPKSHQT